MVEMRKMWSLKKIWIIVIRKREHRVWVGNKICPLLPYIFKDLITCCHSLLQWKKKVPMNNGIKVIV